MIRIRPGLLLTLFLSTGFLPPHSAFAVDPEKTALQKSIQASADKYIAAFAARDAKAIAALFTPEAEYIDADGLVFHGRDVIQAELEANFAANPPGTVAIEFISIRPIAPGIVTEEGISTFTAKDEAGVARNRYSATHVKQPDGSWLMAGVRELGPAELSPHERLKALAFLEGKWREEADSGVVSTEWKWSEDGNFLLARFSISGADNFSLNGTHRIGWDAERKQFRSWIFDASGGFAEGTWTLESDGSWSVHLTGINAQGQRRAGHLVYAPDGKDALVISSIMNSVNGVTLPDYSRRIVRQPPAPAKP